MAAGESGGRRIVVVMLVPVVVASDGVAVSLLRKAGLLDTANAPGPFSARESCVIKINNSTTSMHSLVGASTTLFATPPARPPRLRAFPPPFSHLLPPFLCFSLLPFFLSFSLFFAFHPFYRTLLLNVFEFVSKPSKRDTACRIMMRMHLTR